MHWPCAGARIEVPKSLIQCLIHRFSVRHRYKPTLAANRRRQVTDAWRQVAKQVLNRFQARIDATHIGQNIGTQTGVPGGVRPICASIGRRSMGFRGAGGAVAMFSLLRVDCLVDGAEPSNGGGTALRGKVQRRKESALPIQTTVAPQNSRPATHHAQRCRP